MRILDRPVILTVITITPNHLPAFYGFCEVTIWSSKFEIKEATLHWGSFTEDPSLRILEDSWGFSSKRKVSNRLETFPARECRCYCRWSTRAIARAAVECGSWMRILIELKIVINYQINNHLKVNNSDDWSNWLELISFKRSGSWSPEFGVRELENSESESSESENLNHDSNAWWPIYRTAWRRRLVSFSRQVLCSLLNFFFTSSSASSSSWVIRYDSLDATRLVLFDAIRLLLFIWCHSLDIICYSQPFSCYHSLATTHLLPLTCYQSLDTIRYH